MVSIDRKVFVCSLVLRSFQTQYKVDCQVRRVSSLVACGGGRDDICRMVCAHDRCGAIGILAAERLHNWKLKLQSKKRWSRDSETTLQRRQVWSTCNPHLISLSRVGSRSCTTSQEWRLCLGIPLEFQIALCH